MPDKDAAAGYGLLGMTNIRRFFEDDEAAIERRTASLAALAVTLFIVVVGTYLIKTLQAESALQTCVLSGETYCQVAFGSPSPQAS